MKENKGVGKSLRWPTLGLLTAVELLMSFSFLGYVHIEPISITLGYIPVLAAGVLLGPGESTLVGAVFGLASMWKASASYVMDFDKLFSPALSGKPLESLVLSVGSRAAFGLLVGLLYLLARRLPHPWVWRLAVTYVGGPLHSALVYTCLWLFFPQTGYTPLSSLDGLYTPRGIATGLVSVAVVELLEFFLRSKGWGKFQNRVELAQRLRLADRYHTLSLAVAAAVALGTGLAVTLYFVHRMDYVLEQQGIELSSGAYADLTHLQVQFFIGILSMMGVVIIFLVFNRRYATYKAFEERVDPLTGLMNRKAFFESCSSVLRELPQEEDPWHFLMVDLDWFKEINDTHGHPAGDRALQECARCLREAFGQDQVVLGRVGGDEFAALLYSPMAREELEVSLHRFYEAIHKHGWPDGRRLSCSMGVLRVEDLRPVEELYRSADQLLYQAKAQGRDQYVLAGQREAAGR